MRTLKNPPKWLRVDARDSVTRNGSLRSWGSSAESTARFKAVFTVWAAFAQRGRCVYCERIVGDVARSRPQIEHFVPKGGTMGVAEWTFEVLNLALACPFCNEVRKGSYSPLVGRGRAGAYRGSSFSICQPYLDNMRSHIRGGGASIDGTATVPVFLTDKGRETIRLFDLDSIELRIALEGDWNLVNNRSAIARMNPRARAVTRVILKQLGRT